MYTSYGLNNYMNWFHIDWVCSVVVASEGSINGKFDQAKDYKITSGIFECVRFKQAWLKNGITNESIWLGRVSTNWSRLRIQR